MAFGLELKGISKSFGASSVLDNVSLFVNPGEFVSLVGPSGCGKSTLLRIIAGLEKQDRGEVRIGTTEVSALSPRARNIAMVFQNYALYPHMSAFDNIALPLAMGRLNLLERLPLIKWLSPSRAKRLREITSEVEKVSTQLKIEPLLKRKPGQLSGGQRQRVALARAMVRDPTLFLMDEPLSNLDAQLRVHMRDELTELHARLGATFVYVTHDQVEAMTMSTKVAMLDGGKLAQVGPPALLYERPASLTVARFIGSPSINVLAAARADTGEVLLAGRPIGLLAFGQRDKNIALGIRPEHIRILPLNERGLFSGILKRNEHHGAERLLHITLSAPLEGQVILRVSAADKSATLAHGASVMMTVEKSHIHIFDQDGKRIENTSVATHFAVAAQ